MMNEEEEARTGLVLTFLRSHLFDIIIQDVPEVLPPTLWYKDRVPIVAFHLRDGHVATLLVRFDVEVEVFVLNPEMFVLRAGHCFLRIAWNIFILQFFYFYAGNFFSLPLSYSSMSSPRFCWNSLIPSAGMNT